MPSHKCDKQKIAKTKRQSDRSSTQIPLGTSSCLFI